MANESIFPTDPLPPPPQPPLPSCDKRGDEPDSMMMLPALLDQPMFPPGPPTSIIGPPAGDVMQNPDMDDMFARHGGDDYDYRHHHGGMVNEFSPPLIDSPDFGPPQQRIRGDRFMRGGQHRGGGGEFRDDFDPRMRFPRGPDFFPGPQSHGGLDPGFGPRPPIMHGIGGPGPGPDFPVRAPLSPMRPPGPPHHFYPRGPPMRGPRPPGE